MNKPYAKIVPFKIEHLDLMELRDEEARLVALDPSKYAALAELGWGGTMMFDGRILGALGYFEMWPGVFEVWVIPTVYVPQYARVFLRTVRGYLDRMEETHPVHRFQSPALADPMHDHWMKHCGFVEEGVMPKYSAFKQDFKMWGRVVDDSTQRSR
jgi:hypothetical protein